MDAKYRSRKWLMSVGIQISATLFLALGMIDGDVYGEISAANIVAYSFANAAVYFKKGA